MKRNLTEPNVIVIKMYYFILQQTIVEAFAVRHRAGLPGERVFTVLDVARVSARVRRSKFRPHRLHVLHSRSHGHAQLGDLRFIVTDYLVLSDRLRQKVNA
jgi:hypothetical protein